MEAVRRQRIETLFRRMRRQPALAILAALAIMAAAADACGHGVFPENSSNSSAGGGGSTTARSVYVTNFADHKIAALANSSGTLSSPTTLAAGAANGPLGLALTPPGSTVPKALYVANPADGLIHEFGVNSSGNLNSLATISAGTQPQQVAVDSTGAFAYAINGGGSIAQYTINASTGALSANTPASMTTGLTAPVSAAAAGSFLYVTDPSGGAGLVLTYTIGGGGLLALASSVPTGGTNPNQIAAVSASNGLTWVFVGDSTSGVVTVFQVQGTALALVGTVGTGVGTAGLAFGTTSTGLSFLYVANPSTNSVASFSFNLTTGVLAPFATTTGFNPPTGLAVDNPASASTLFVVNNGAGSVTTLPISAQSGGLGTANTFATENPANASSKSEYVAVIP
jgi:6-phosphogluconolactonase (cycloisomerase 2 family)